MGVVDIVGGKVGIMPPERDYKPPEPYRRDRPALTRDSNLPQGPSRRLAAEQNREAVLWALEQIGGQATTARVVNVLNDTQPGANRKVGQTLRNMVSDGLVESVPTIGEESVWTLPGMVRKDIPEFPPPLAKNPPRTERDDYWRKMKDAIVWALKELGGQGKAGDIIIALGAEDNRTDRLRIGIQARLLESEGALKRVGVDHQKVTTWALVTDTEPTVNKEEEIKDVDTELATELMLADLKKRMAKPELPANSDRMIVELRGVASQFQAIGASEVLINDFRLLANWIEGLRND